jgi:hypothetical protein
LQNALAGERPSGSLLFLFSSRYFSVPLKSRSLLSPLGGVQGKF